MDLPRALKRIPHRHAALLTLYGMGYSVREAHRLAGLKGNPTREMRRALQMVCEVLGE